MDLNEEFKLFYKICIDNGYKKVSQEQKECLKKAIDESTTYEEILAVWITALAINGTRIE